MSYSGEDTKPKERQLFGTMSDRGTPDNTRRVTRRGRAVQMTEKGLFYHSAQKNKN